MVRDEVVIETNFRCNVGRPARQDVGKAGPSTSTTTTLLEQRDFIQQSVSKMDDTVPPDGWDAISQIEEFYRMLRSPCDSDAPPYLPTILQMWCKSLITMVDLLLAHNSEVLRDDLLSSCLRDHRRGLHELLSPLMAMPSRLMALPYELREQIFAFAVTEWIAAPDQSAEASTPPRTGVRVLQQRPIRIDRLNKPAPPGRRALLQDQRTPF